MEKIDAIILAGGEGKRLRSLVQDTPKPLAEVGAKPFLDILLAQLDKCNCINRLVLAVGYKAERIVEAYKDCSAYNFDIGFSVEETLLGTGGAIKKGLGYTETKDVLAMNGDSYTEVNIEDLINTHRNNKAKLTIVLLEIESAGRYGSVKVDAHNRILSFEEKQGADESGLINAGIYVMQRDVFDTIEENRVVSLEKDVLPGFVKMFQGEIYGYTVNGKFIDIGVPASYMRADAYLKTLEG